MAELDPVADPDQPPGLGRGRRGRGEPQVRSGPPEQGSITGRIGRGGQQQGLGVRGQPADFLQVPLLEAPAEGQRLGQRGLPGQLVAGQPLGDLDERQRVAPGLGHDAQADGPIQPGTGGGGQQLAGRRVVQAAEPQLGQPFEDRGPGCRFPDGEDHRDGVGVQAARGERERGR